MRIKEEFVLRNIGCDHIIMAQGDNVDFSKLISLNKTAAWLWKNLLGKEFSIQVVVDLLVSQFNVDEQTAQKDAKELLDGWLNIGIIEN